MNIKTLKQNFNIGDNRFISRHPNASVIYFLIDSDEEILYIGETEERRWDLRRVEHIKSGKKFHKMLVCQTGKFKKEVLLIEKGLILMLSPVLNKEKPTWKKKYMDAAKVFLESIEGDTESIKVIKDVEYVERIVETVKEVIVEVPVEVVREKIIRIKNRIEIENETRKGKVIKGVGVFLNFLALFVLLGYCYSFYTNVVLRFSNVGESGINILIGVFFLIVHFYSLFPLGLFLLESNKENWFALLFDDECRFRPFYK